MHTSQFLREDLLKQLRQFCMDLALVLALSIPAFAGDMPLGVTGDMLGGLTGDMGNGITGNIECGITGDILSLLLSLFS